MKIILASSSRYRLLQCQQAGLVVEAVAPKINEDEIKDSLRLPPAEVAKELSRQKGHSLAEDFPNDIIVAGDQLVSFEGEILGKPGSRAGAIAQLKHLAGKSHQLLSACTIILGKQNWCHLNVTTLWMRPLTEQVISRYVDREQPIDCAGSYKFESAGIALFEKVETDDPSAITGLPMMFVVGTLFECGYTVF